MPLREPTLDLIAVGRSSVDLYGEQLGGRLENMASFAKYVGGSPTNTAIGAARLGLKSGLLTRVGDDHMGRFVREQLAREGVDVTGVVTDRERLTSLVILGIRDQTTFPLIFYRENCADSALSVADVDGAWVSSAGAIVINGTHLSQPSLYDASLAALKAVKATHGLVVLDIDYRPVLWGLTRRDRGEDRFVSSTVVTEQLQGVLGLCDVVVGTEDEIRIVGGSVDTITALRAIRARTRALLICKRGPDGCSAFPGALPEDLDAGTVSRAFPVEVFNVLGAGDAFMAGFLRGLLKGEPLDRCCQWGNACGAIVVSRHGCAPAMPTWQELQYFLGMTDRPYRLRDDAQLEHIHWAATRRGNYDELTVLAIDHRSQFEELAHETGADSLLISRFKELALQVLDSVAAGAPSFGLLIDGRYGTDVLAKAGDTPYWVGRPIEIPKSRPLQFEGSPDVATELSAWPLNQVVKCLVICHPDDDPGLRTAQERQLLRLFDACRKTGHELLLEVIVPRDKVLEPNTVARVIRRLYSLGIRPDWWKLKPAADAFTWTLIDRAIRENDSWCRGVVLLGLSAPEEELIASFETAAPFEIVKGFAVGRTVFYDIAREWFLNRIDDKRAIELLAEKFSNLVAAWRRLRLPSRRKPEDA
jgi:5-dehydro-2-deoxygluconokinase